MSVMIDSSRYVSPAEECFKHLGLPSDLCYAVPGAGLTDGLRLLFLIQACANQSQIISKIQMHQFLVGSNAVRRKIIYHVHLL